MSGTLLRTELIPAGGEIQLGEANFFFLLSATLAVDVNFQADGSSYGAAQVTGGYVKGKIAPWRRATIRGTAGSTVVFFYGDEELREDITDFRQTIATIAGLVGVTDAPSSTLATAARQTVANANKVTIAANLARRRITISNPSDNATPGLVYVQTAAAGAGRGYPLDSGLSVEFRTTAALDVRNDSGGAVDITTFEES